MTRNLSNALVTGLPFDPTPEPEHTMTAPRYTLKRTGRTWSILDDKGQIVEGGFFSRAAAEDALAQAQAQAADDSLLRYAR
jgi:hypothetical protein